MHEGFNFLIFGVVTFVVGFLIGLMYREKAVKKKSKNDEDDNDSADWWKRGNRYVD